MCYLLLSKTDLKQTQRADEEKQERCGSLLSFPMSRHGNVFYSENAASFGLRYLKKRGIVVSSSLSVLLPSLFSIPSCLVFVFVFL